MIKFSIQVSAKVRENYPQNKNRALYDAPLLVFESRPGLGE